MRQEIYTSISQKILAGYCVSEVSGEGKNPESQPPILNAR